MKKKNSKRQFKAEGKQYLRAYLRSRGVTIKEVARRLQMSEALLRYYLDTEIREELEERIVEALMGLGSDIYEDAQRVEKFLGEEEKKV